MALVYRISLAAIVLAAVAVSAVVGAPTARHSRQNWLTGSIVSGSESSRPSCESMHSDHPCLRLYPRPDPIVGYPTEADDMTHLTSLSAAQLEFRSSGFEKMVNNSRCRADFGVVAAFLCAAYFPPCTPSDVLIYPCRDMCDAARNKINSTSAREIINSCPGVRDFLSEFSVQAILNLPLLQADRYAESGPGSICIPLSNVLTTPTVGPTPKDVDPIECEQNATECATPATETGSGTGAPETTATPETVETPTEAVPETPETTEPSLGLCSVTPSKPRDNCTECSVKIRDNLSRRTFIQNYDTMKYAFKVQYIDYVRGPKYWSLKFTMIHSYFDDCAETPSNGANFTINIARRTKCCLCDDILEYFQSPVDCDNIFVIAGQARERDGTCTRWLQHTDKKSLVISECDTTFSDSKMDSAVERRS